jgi:predicted nuclease of restriction endonuclease-like (RecB) superfamily
MNNTELQTTQNKQMEQFDKKEYQDFIIDLKKRYKSAQLRASIKLNTEVIEFYWDVGKRIVEKQQTSQWGDKVLQRISKDMQEDNPKIKGFSVRNLEHMRNFALTYQCEEITKQAVSQLPWGHIILLIQRVKDEQKRIWYIDQTVDNGWSRQALSEHIKSDLYSRQAIDSNKVSNFAAKLPEPQSRLAHDMIKNPYNFAFLELHDEAVERDIENGLIRHMGKFLIEIGKEKGLSFAGNQFPISVGGQDFYIDMLFYNYKLRCFVVIEIKAEKFKPEHAGKLNFYLTAVDEHLKSEHDNPSIGLLLCKSQNKVVAEYALKDVNKPIGISEYDLIKSIPEDLKKSLPTVEELEQELNS